MIYLSQYQSEIIALACKYKEACEHVQQVWQGLMTEVSKADKLYEAFRAAVRRTEYVEACKRAVEAREKLLACASGGVPEVGI